jgi:dTDP-glucose pyrophosphorylase
MVPVNTSLHADATLFDAVRAIEASHRRIAVVTSETGALLGTLTDGDVRRCLLAGGNLQTSVSNAMNPRPLTALPGSKPGYLIDIMKRGNVLAIPLVDERGRFVELVHLMDLSAEPGGSGFQAAAQFAFAVIMAGGEGARLRPITQNIPKPMIEIAGVPLLERQVRRLAEASVRRIYVSVNYLSHIIEDHFGDGSRFGVEIRYLRERVKLGTAGALSLLPEQPEAPIIVMNGDILTTSSFASLEAFHRAHQAHVTVAAIDYRVNIPYGVLCADGPYVTEVLEKPAQRFLCNAGIYAVSPQAVPLVPAGERFDMTQLIECCLAHRQLVAVFPLHEYWSDIGTPDDLERARSFFERGSPT